MNALRTILNVTPRSGILGLALTALGGLAACSSADGPQPSDLVVAAVTNPKATDGGPTGASLEGDAGSPGASSPEADSPDAGPPGADSPEAGSPEAAADACCCHMPGRFTAAGANRVLDTSTGLAWETAMRPPAFWSDAAAACSSVGMRLPSYKEWLGVMLITQMNAVINTGSGDSPSCTGPRSVYVAPFDQVAMPTTMGELGGSGGFAALWTSESDPNEAGAYYTVNLNWGGGEPWIVIEGDEWPMKLSGQSGNAYRCVQ